MKRITLLTFLCMFLTIPIALGQTSFRHANFEAGVSGNTVINGPAGSASIANGSMLDAPSVTITQSTTQDIVPFNSVSCPSGDDSFFRDFDLSSDGITNDFDVTAVEFGVEDFTGSLTVTANIYSMAAGTFPGSYPGSATLQGSASVLLTAADKGSIVSLPLTATVPAGQHLIYELFAPDFTAGGDFYPGSNPDGQSGVSYIQSAPCGATIPLDITALGFPDMHLVFNVVGEEASGGGGPITYCTASGNSPTYENITNVTYAGIDNTTSTHSGYNDFTAQVASVTQGGTDEISVTITADGSDYVYVFIDWNQNGTLDDAGEVYTLATSTSSPGPHIMDITVPAGAALGDTRMRVKVGWLESTPNPCGTFSYGEIEDYTVNVDASGGGGGGIPPIIACPSDIMANTDPGECGAVVNFGVATAIDPDGGTVTVTQTMGDSSGSVFPTGDTIIEFTATDDQGDVSTCQFTITVTDNEAPIAVCQNITVDLDTSGSITITPAEVDNGSTDNCGITSMTLDVSSFDCSMTGDNTVTLTITDIAGNSSTCTSTVTVQDVTAPDIACLGGLDTFSETEDFEGSSIPSGWTTEVQVGSYDWTFGSGDMPAGPDFPSNAAIFDDDAAGSGEVNVASLLSPVYDLSVATSASLSFDYILKDFIGSGFLNVEVYDGTGWQQVLLVDNADVGPINTGDIDMMAYANAAFQVRFTYDDEGEWAYGAGIDNFALNYEQIAPGGLDVFLDADGMASINPNDLVSNVNEACGYTITAGGVGGGSAGSLTTLFTSNNGGSAGWTVMYDITVGPSDIEITDIDVNTDAAAAFNLDFYTLEGTYVGNETNPGAWGAPATTGSGTGAGIDQPSNAVLVDPVTLSANTTYGIAIILDSKPKYTNGTGCPGNQCYDNSDLSITLGAAVAGEFTGTLFPNRVFNGTIHYVTGAGSGLDFTCADVGSNLVEVTVTDDSGNVSTCTAVVNVIDNIAPVLTCGSSNVTTEMEDFEGSGLPAGWSTEVLAGTDDWMFGSGVMPTGDNFPTNAAIFDDDAAGSGEVNVVRLISPTYDLTGTSNVTVGYDIAFQESGNQEFKVEVYDGANWQEIASYDEDLNPNIQTESIDVSAYVNADFQVRFTYDDLGGWGWGAGVDNFKITYENASTSNVVDIELGPDGTATIDPYSLLSNIEEACGIGTIAVDVTTVSCADIGTPIMVTVFVSDTSGNVASCVAEINVVDLLAPEITCPADQTVDPGAGNLFYILPDYFATGEATADDNCTEPVTVTTQDPAPGIGLPDGTHTITLTATDEYGNTSTCSFVLTVETILGNSDNALSSGVSLYPNPASSVVNLVNKTNISLKTMTMFDVNGKQVSQVNLIGMQGEKVVDISSLASGVYIVQIVGDKASTVKRLIKE